MVDKSGIAFAEVYDIIKHSDESIRKKISQSFINLIEKNRDKTYKIKINYNEELTEPNIQYETKVILGIIYRDYLCSPEERDNLLRVENEMFSQIDRVNQEKYSVDNLFKNTKYSTNDLTPKQENSIAIIEKEKWYKRLFKAVICIFKKN